MTLTKVGRSKLAKARKSLTPAELFFYEHAGYSYSTKDETPEQGHIRCAKSLADAEDKARNLGWEVNWGDDWGCGSHRQEFGEDAYPQEPETCEFASLHDGHDNVLASLGCIDNADSNYRRVIEAELASEALERYDREVEVLDAH